MTKISETIKRYRHKKGWSQSKLAEKCGIHYTTIMKIEQGYTPQWETLVSICEALGLELLIREKEI